MTTDGDRLHAAALQAVNVGNAYCEAAVHIEIGCCVKADPEIAAWLSDLGDQGKLSALRLQAQAQAATNQGVVLLVGATEAGPCAMTEMEARAVLARLVGEHTWGSSDNPKIVRRARAAAHPDRNDGDRTDWDLVEQAAAVLGVL